MSGPPEDRGTPSRLAGALLRSPGVGGSPDETLTAPELIEDYLDHLCAPLVGLVPFRERARLREETAFHLERETNNLQLTGIDERTAALEAIQRYGMSETIGQRFLETWFAAQPKGWLARRLGLAVSYAVVPFGLATLAVNVLLMLRVYMMPSPQILTFGLSYAQERKVIPEPLPLPESNWQSVLLYVVALFAPIAAGWFTGVRAPVASARAVYLVQMVMIVYTFVFSTLAMPLQEGVVLALFQVFFWLPVGCAMAHVAGLVAWRQRSRRFVVQTKRADRVRPGRLPFAKG